MGDQSPSVNLFEDKAVMGAQQMEGEEYISLKRNPFKIVKPSGEIPEYENQFRSRNSKHMKMNSMGVSEASTMGKEGMGYDNPESRGVSSVRNAQKKGIARGSTAAFVSSQHTGGSVGKGGNAETLSNDLESYHKNLLRSQ
jgi:hypothetical protein